ncbi:cilia- and flagella-associated protein 337 [Diretmus argenteus]
MCRNREFNQSENVLKSFSILSELGSTGERTVDTSGPGGRAGEVTDEFLAPIRPEGDRKPPPEWLVREWLKQNRRRHSVTFGDKAQLTTQLHHSADSTGSLKSQIQRLFMKIDYSGRGRVAWDDLCTYMQLEYREKEECVIRSKQAAFTLPATVRAACHGVPIRNIHSTPDGAIVTVREDGTVCYWSSELQLQKTKSVFHERAANRSSKWASDFTPMTQYSKLIIGTGDREIQLYELSSLEPYCQISALETVPLTLDYCSTGPDECYILYGDGQGCVNIIIMSSVAESLRLWNKLPKVENVPNIAIDTAVLSPNVTFIRWKVHHDWVTQAKYFPNIHAIVSTSNEEAFALVIGRALPSTNVEQQLREIREVVHEGKAKKVQMNWTPQPRASCDQTVFTIYKGVKTFDLCKKHNLLVTGGMDRFIRVWNPYVPGKPTGILKGHSAPIFYLCISSENNQIFSVSTDNTVKIWDIQDQCCLFTALPKDSRICGDISACLYSPSIQSLYIAADSMASLSLKMRPQLLSHRILSHDEPVMCCGFSEQFGQVVSCTEGSVVKVWDFNTGSQVFEFGGAHGLFAITCLTFDPEGRRLITGGRDGCLKIWNFNNGQCLKILKRDGECHEVCDCAYLRVHRNVCVMSVGWDRKIDIYSDPPEDGAHVQRPQPSWPDDLRNGHKDDILCIAQCPPSLLATSSYDGEILVWNVASGHILCHVQSPLPPEYQNVRGVDTSVPSIIFLRKCMLNGEFSSATGLVSSGTRGYVHFWNVLNGGKFVSSFEASKFQRKITKLAKTEGDTLLYAADHIGYIYVYNMEKCALGRGEKPPRDNQMGMHLQIVDNDRVVLTSSTDCTVRLWSASGEFIGTFGQPEKWSIHIPSSWKHPAVPYEVLIDPLSMPVHGILNGKTCISDAIDHDNTEAEREELNSAPHSEQQPPLLSISDTEIEEDIKTGEHGKRFRHEIFTRGYKLPKKGPKCCDIVDPPFPCVRPDLSLAGIDPFTSHSTDEETG